MVVVLKCHPERWQLLCDVSKGEECEACLVLAPKFQPSGTFLGVCIFSSQAPDKPLLNWSVLVRLCQSGSVAQVTVK